MNNNYDIAQELPPRPYVRSKDLFFAEQIRRAEIEERDKELYHNSMVEGRM